MVLNNVVLYKPDNINGRDGVATVAIGNPERHVRRASHHGSKQQ